MLKTNVNVNGSVLSIDTKWPFREIVPDVALKLRIEYAGAIYHVMNRGDHREPIFRDDGDRERFLETLGQACRGTDWRVHAWCLMLNHSAPGDDDDITMDRGSVKDGDLEPCGEPALPSEGLGLCQYSGLTRLRSKGAKRTKQRPIVSVNISFL